MGSDSSHEFGEFMSAVIYIIIFAVSVGVGLVMVKDSVKISGKYNVEQYYILNSILVSLNKEMYSDGRYYVRYDYVQECLENWENAEECFGISSRYYFIEVFIPFRNEVIRLGSLENKKTYALPLLIEYDGKYYFSRLIIGV